jgi:lipopolysaccharide export LptBFGC system permease protein LptF
VAVAWKETLKRTLWLLAAPVLVLLAVAYLKLAERRGALATLIFPYGVVLFLIFVTSKTDVDRGP